ncbi:hypothetical protein [Streptomyces sp. NPDC060333]|uniref:hypothetical protein n=1 Tax=Streptomyces sp. NPDC060333 TaxID=3347098 RepID=UPI0036696F2D
MALMKRRASLKNEFYEWVSNETRQSLEPETQLQGDPRQAQKDHSNQLAAIDELRQLVTRLTLAGAVRVQGKGASTEPIPAPDNVIPFRPARRLSPGLSQLEQTAEHRSVRDEARRSRTQLGTSTGTTSRRVGDACSADEEASGLNDRAELRRPREIARPLIERSGRSGQQLW